MLCQIKKILKCLCLIVSLMFVVVHAETLTTTATNDLITYDVFYTVTTTDNGTILNANFTVTNNESESENALLIAAIYDEEGRMVTMQKTEPTIVSGTTVSETVSVTIPENKNDSYDIRLYAWEGAGSLKPLGKHKMVSDIDPYLREKSILITSTENTEFKVFMNAFTVNGNASDVIHTIEYDTTKMIPTDLCGFTDKKELSATTVQNTNVIIDTVDTTNGIIRYRFSNDSGRNTGTNNIIKFKALTSITDEEIKYTIQ